MILHIHYTINSKKQIVKEKISIYPAHTFTNKKLTTGKQEKYQLPFLQLQFDLRPNNKQDYQLTLQLQTSQAITIQQLFISLPYSFQTDDQMFCNGFQSWTESRLYSIQEKIPFIRSLFAPIAQHMGDYWIIKDMGIDLTNTLHSWTYTYIQQNKGTIFFIGSRNEYTGYTLIQHAPNQHQINIYKDCKSLKIKANNTFLAFDLYLNKGQETPIFSNYIQQLTDVCATKKNLHSSVKLPDSTKPIGHTAGWTSWYHYYDRISEKIVIDNLQAFRNHQVPIKFFQIDDGWQHKIGDWMVRNAKFPKGMGWLHQQIQAAGYQSGLWLAPFICQKQSSIYQHHSDWLLKQENGHFVTAGINPIWRSHLYVLDFYHPEVRQYLTKVFQLILHTWSFNMVKLDFLYAVARQPPTHKTRGQVMYEAMTWLRDQIGDKIILGCGVPLGAAFNQVDYCRIGADIHLGWEMRILKWMRSRERASTILSLRNTIHRRQLNGLAFYNDPDVSILRQKKNWLSSKQRHSLFLVNQIFGSLQFISDNIADYDSETLQLYLSQFPIRPKIIEKVIAKKDYYIIYFSCHHLHYIALCNLSPHAIIQSCQQLFTVEQKATIQLFHHQEHQWYKLTETIELLPYQSICLLVVDTKRAYTLAGSTGHLFPASEIDDWSVKNNGDIQLHFSKKLRNKATVYVWSQHHGQITPFFKRGC